MNYERLVNQTITCRVERPRGAAWIGHVAFYSKPTPGSQSVLPPSETFTLSFSNSSLSSMYCKYVL
jgi:hypothetical protein